MGKNQKKQKQNPPNLNYQRRARNDRTKKSKNFRGAIMRNDFKTQKDVFHRNGIG